MSNQELICKLLRAQQKTVSLTGNWLEQYKRRYDKIYPVKVIFEKKLKCGIVVTDSVRFVNLKDAQAWIDAVSYRKEYSAISLVS